MYGDERDPEMRAFLQKISPLNNGAPSLTSFCTCNARFTFAAANCVAIQQLANIMFPPQFIS
jgi:hypothetical protein